MLRKTSHYERLLNFSAVPTFWHELFFTELFFKGFAGNGTQLRQSAVGENDIWALRQQRPNHDAGAALLRRPN
ncbi:MAG: hypothetical protein ACLQVY_10125 [Limisphaerales bacterium]